MKESLDDATRGSSLKYCSLLKFKDPNQNQYSLSAIRMEHEEQVRALFKQCYAHLFESYPSVKKLVKSALRNDLSVKSSQVTSHDGLGSSIWCHYSKSGGAFWVVSTKNYNNWNQMNGCLATNITDVFQIVGCIGIKKKSCNPVTYEINRLVVHPSFRKIGLGRQLLKCTEDFVRGKELGPKLEIVASTPTILEISNHFYSANGFYVEQEALLGKLVIRTFRKEI